MFKNEYIFFQNLNFILVPSARSQVTQLGTLFSMFRAATVGSASNLAKQFLLIIKWISSNSLYILLSANIPQETIPDLYVIVRRYSNLLWEKDGSQHGHFLWAEWLRSPGGGPRSSQEGRHPTNIFSWHSSGLWSAQPTRPLVVRNVLSASAGDSFTIQTSRSFYPK